MRILCLHGAHQSAVIFRERLMRFEHHFKNSAELFFLDGPSVMPLQDGQDVALRCWWGVSRDVATSEEWDAVLRTFHEFVATHGPFDACVGFSQGAMCLALLCREGHLATAKVKCVVLAGCPPVAGLEGELIRMPSLHCIGASDELVSVSASRSVAAMFSNGGILLAHPGGHIVPQRPCDLAVLDRFFNEIAATNVFESEATLREECELLASVFEPSEFRVVFSPMPPSIEFSLCPTTDACLRLVIPPSYPKAPPRLQVHNVSLQVHHTLSFVAFLTRLHELCLDRMGDVVLFELLSCAREGFVDCMASLIKNNEAAETDTTVVAPSVFTLDEEDAATRARNMDDAFVFASECSVVTHSQHEHHAGGSWSEFVVGLVGKPSAGKSTLFNATTDPQDDSEAAKVGAHPFTTIEPNYGAGFAGMVCACRAFGVAHRCGAKYGHISEGVRRVPIRVKDVAGLVPGAYMGCGHGNKFLDDLCDADVLIHVVDASGCTNERGEEEGERSGDPVHEVRWVRDEIHAWIYDNVAHKWPSVRHQPEKRLVQLFSGYHAKQSIIQDTLRAMGLPLKDLTAQLSRWKRADIHRLVAVFLRHRFPIVVALNKCDKPSAAANVARVVDAYPREVVVAMSAMAHTKLLQARSSSESLSSTGVETAMSTAMAQRPAMCVFPLQDVETLEAGKGDEGSVFHHCVLMRCGSSVYDVYRYLQGDHILQGDFVGAQSVDASKKTSMMKRDDIISKETSVLRVMTNRKSAWQRNKAR